MRGEGVFRIRGEGGNIEDPGKGEGVLKRMEGGEVLKIRGGRRSIEEQWRAEKY